MKHWKRLNNLRRDRILNEFNRENMDDLGPIGGTEQGMKVLSEMNSMVDNHYDFMKSMEPRVEVV